MKTQNQKSSRFAGLTQSELAKLFSSMAVVRFSFLERTMPCTSAILFLTTSWISARRRSRTV